MQCPECSSESTRVLDSRKVTRDGRQRKSVVRRRQCKACGERFSTVESYTGQVHDELDALNARLEQAASHVKRISANRFLTSE